MAKLTTIDAVIAVMGGTAKCARALAAPYSAVSNWRRDGMFPANTYLAVKKYLRARNLTAPDNLWPMRDLQKEGSP